jgi:hypothetical protein
LHCPVQAALELVEGEGLGNDVIRTRLERERRVVLPPTPTADDDGCFCAFLEIRAQEQPIPSGSIWSIKMRAGRSSSRRAVASAALTA